MSSCKVSVQGNVVEVTWIDSRNTTCHAIKLDGEHWVDPETGEIHEYEKKSDKRTDNTQELLKTFATIRALVNTNCKDPKLIRWITLTYAENMTDTKRLYKDFHDFWLRFKRRWGKAEYIAVIEPQGRGAWHVHLIAIWQDRAPFVPNAELRECWGHGFVKVNAVTDNCDNLGAYLSAYLADVEVPADGDGTEKQVNGQTKRFKKNGRLGMYPAHMQIYRTSRGIKRPEVFWTDEEQDKERYERLVEGREPVYEREITFKDDEGREHHVVKQQYNLIRGGADSDGFQSMGTRRGQSAARGADGAARGRTHRGRAGAPDPHGAPARTAPEDLGRAPYTTGHPSLVVGYLGRSRRRYTSASVALSPSSSS